jgi:hypothetical protein
MRLLLVMILWSFLFLLCWPLALALLILYPIIWLIALPFRIVGLLAEALLATLKAILLLPARLLSPRIQHI